MRNADAAVLSKRISNQSTTDYISPSLSLFVSLFIAPSCNDTAFLLKYTANPGQVTTLFVFCVCKLAASRVGLGFHVAVLYSCMEPLKEQWQQVLCQHL